ncbi:MAG: folate-binding protein YgfZ [Acidobacteria bacterium]|nr:folate-binding protein YgfZ [Acidobacteriota bacterium]
MDIETYNHIRSGGAGYIEMPRGLIAVWGKEAVQFLDGMITNDMKTLEDGQQMLAAFPNAQGRLLAVVRVLRQGDRFLFETEEATREKLFQNLFRFTFAGDFFVEDLSETCRFSQVWNFDIGTPESVLRFKDFQCTTWAIPNDEWRSFIYNIYDTGGIKLDNETWETLRIESGIPLYGVDMDETTIVPELGLDGLISYNKGCYIGQEIIARIYFRGHVAKRLTGLMSEPGAIATGFSAGAELTTSEGKNAGRITSVTYSPKLDKTIALAYVRYDHLAEGTELKVGESDAVVRNLPFVE